MLEDSNDRPMAWVGDYSGRRAVLTPDRTAVIDGATGRYWSFEELDDAVTRVAVWLEDSIGVGVGDRVALISANRVEALCLYLACGKTGTVLVPVSHRLTAADMGELIRRSGARAVLADPQLDTVVAGWPQLELPWWWLDESTLAAEPVVPIRPVNRPLRLNDPFLYVHTGGSTGTPKLCVISHRQMLWNSFELIAANPEGLGRRRELVIFPFGHIGGWNTVTPVLHAGGCVVLLPAFDPGAVLETIARYRINHFGAVEAMLTAIAEHPAFASTDLASLQAITTAGAPCSDVTMAPFRQRGIAVGQSYGQTEAGPSNFIHLAREGDPESLARHSQSIGTALMHCDYRIVDAHGADAADGSAGELWLRSPHSFDGYVGDPERTARVLDDDGWVHTGDLAREEPDGRVYLVGRADNMFVSGGENIAPEEIEAVLGGHPAVAEAAVYPESDPRWGQVAAALLVPAGSGRPDAEELGQWLEPRLARFKHPRRYHWCRALPRTGTGKIDRARLAAPVSPE
ncbi:class I adenylate-forming enzyme family protein [Arhodomonas sp. SL1]|uniref:class I adenylate-forming enzyme family protein n=1 Tax=Arhodomonas sp. SL1 TaxID=3425691 RepID=UPI003F880A74